MRETRLSGSEGGGARDSPYPYNSFRRYASNHLSPREVETARPHGIKPVVSN